MSQPTMPPFQWNSLQTSGIALRTDVTHVILVPTSTTLITLFLCFRTLRWQALGYHPANFGKILSTHQNIKTEKKTIAFQKALHLHYALSSCRLCSRPLVIQFSLTSFCICPPRHYSGVLLAFACPLVPSSFQHREVVYCCTTPSSRLSQRLHALCDWKTHPQLISLIIQETCCPSE